VNSIVSITSVPSTDAPDESFIAHQLRTALAMIQSYSEEIDRSLSISGSVMPAIQANNDALLMHVVRLRALISGYYDMHQYPDAGEHDDAQWDSLSGE